MITIINKRTLLRISILLVLFVVASLNFGCIERKYTLITSPADCEVYFDGKYVGNTVERLPNDPNAGKIDVPFVYYAESEIVIKKKDYESRTEFIKASTPWYEYFPIDFFSEVLIPYTIHVRFLYRFDLKKYEDIDADELMDKAEGMRDYSLDKLKNSDEISE